MSTEEFPRPGIGARAPVPAATPPEEIAGIRDVTFPIALRGYEREAVEAYVRRVNRIIAELEVSRSPQSAIRHALEEVSEETKGILERAHETADEITARSRARADDRVQQAEAEARETIAAAEARVRGLEAELDALWQERGRVLDEVREIARQLATLADTAAERVPAGQEAPPAAATAELEEPAVGEPEPELGDLPAPEPTAAEPGFEPAPEAAELEPEAAELEPEAAELEPEAAELEPEAAELDELPPPDPADADDPGWSEGEPR